MTSTRTSPSQPLPERVRPEELSDLIGQEKIWHPGSTLFQLISKDRFFSLIFWGPPGTGKTSLAKLVALHSEREFVSLSAVTSGVKDIRAEIERSQELKSLGNKAILMFMDEIHRLNKAQQDVLLPALESGYIKFIGATTENPSFEVNKAVLSRSTVFRFEQITTESLVKIMRNALANPNSKLRELQIDDDVLERIAQASDGDARRALNILDVAVESLDDNIKHVTVDALRNVSFDLVTKYDKNGDQHYDIISAMIKSVRASHPDAAVYYLARMIDAGEEAMFLARRLVILASEDIGNANPTALLVATAGMQAVHMVGYPEARIILSQVATYLAASPKSNRSYEAIGKALGDVKEFGSLEVPLHLRNAPSALMKQFGYGKNYAYAHTQPDEAKKLNYLPEKLKGKRYYVPSDMGVERQLKENLEKLKPYAD